MAIKTTWGNSDGLFVLGGEIADNRYAVAFANPASQETENGEPVVEPQAPAPDPAPQEVSEPESPEPGAQDEPTKQDGGTEATNNAEEVEPAAETTEQPEALETEATEQAILPESAEPEEVATKVVDSSKTNKKLKKPKTTKQPGKPIKHKKLLIGGLSFVILVAFILGGGWLYFRGRVLPNTYVAGQNVAGLKQTNLENLINDKQKSFTVTVKGVKKILKPTQKNLGLTFNANQTVANVMAVHRAGNFWQHVMWWQRTNVNLNPKINQKQLTKYLKTNVKTATKSPQDAKLVFDATNNEFKIQKQILGSGILVSKATDTILSSAQSASPIEVDVPTQTLSANIVADNLKSSLETANDYIKTPVSLNLKDTTYTPSVAERASWLKLTMNKTKKKYDIKVLPAQISLYISGISAPFHQDVTQRITIKNKTTGVKTVLQNGLDGQDVNNQAQVSAALTKAIIGQQSYTGKLKIITIPHKSQDITALAKWAYVSLSTQTVTAYNYDKPIKSFLISSGVPKYPTNVGVFKVWYKTPVQTMRGGSKASGDYYDLPNVHWDTYFDGDIAVHEAYWHNNFGHPMSHGCLNASYASAKWFYDFAPIGTTVVVVP